MKKSYEHRLGPGNISFLGLALALGALWGVWLARVPAGLESSTDLVLKHLPPIAEETRFAEPLKPQPCQLPWLLPRSQWFGAEGRALWDQWLASDPEGLYDRLVAELSFHEGDLPLAGILQYLSSNNIQLARAWITRLALKDMAVDATLDFVAFRSSQPGSLVNQEAEWVLTLPKSQTRERALAEVMRSWMKGYPSAGAAWLRQAIEKPLAQGDLDEAASVVGEWALSQKDTRSALCWVAAVRSREIRQPATFKIARQVLRDGGTLSQDQITACGIPSEEAALIVQIVHSERPR
jgi:hypothetical protein